MTSRYRDGRPGGRLRRVRYAGATVLAVLFAVLLPAAITAVWIRGTVLSTSGYVAAVTPVAADPTVRAAVRAAAAEEIDPLVSHATDALPPVVGILAMPLSGGLAGIAGDGISSFMAVSAFQRLWITANRSVHDQLISVLNGNSAAVATTNGEVVLNLAPLINDVLKELSGRLSALTGKAIALPTISAVPAVGCRQVANLTGARLPADCGQLPLFPASALDTARRGFTVINAASLALLVLVPLTAAAALLAAPRRRRALLQLSIGGSVTVIAMTIAMSRLRSSLADRAQPRWQPAVAAVLHALTNGFFSLAMWCVISGLILTVAALISHVYPRVTAIRDRNAERVSSASH